jgi:CheY-like chemotaxis protein
VADEGKLRQAMINLVGNAVKFTSQGGVTVRLASRPLAGPQRESLVVEVEDTGPGIAQADQKLIFEPFVQVGSASGRKGTGLGLAIARQFAELMGGSVGVRSMLGSGSTFRIEVPVGLPRAAAMVPEGHPRAREAGMAHLAPGQPELRVLIVEDQEENWLLLRQLLVQADLSVRVAHNGAEGVDEFQSWRPQFIWMDWRMPVMDGLEATRRIRALQGGGDVKIAVLSASVLAEEREQVIAAGVDDFVPKPIRFSSIFDCMTRHLGVRFVVVEPLPSERGEPPEGLSAEAVHALPASVRSELANALVSLDATRIAESIRLVAKADAHLGDVLDKLAGAYQYTTIMRAVQPRAGGESGGPTT